MRARGITLIELLIAMSVMAVLMTLALPAYTHATQRARRTAAHSALLSLQLAQSRYRAAHDRYASDLSELCASVSDATGCSPQTHYVMLVSTDSNEDPASSFHLTAKVRNDAAQGDDLPCQTIELIQEGGILHYKPDVECWNQ